mgnify:CR=1 FL=1
MEHQPEPPINKDAQSTPTEGGEHGLEHGTCQQWLRWLGEQVSGVADRLDEEQRSRGHLMRTTTEELEKVRAQMQSMEEELTKAKENAANMATMGQQSNIDIEPVVTTKKQKATPKPEPEPEPAVEEASKTNTESAQELRVVRE